ncbi:hypothetical protein [Argonema galeatum]|uniref:hypothetical protein n=1 Tax=Argonema galeatum TaxID=2942762 RepID=UPI002011C31F|nr:hypothetical protein [Argonema galeatum]MCL1468677.1 hypothetical protein [Argonema galeatum A003/A1]
MVFQEFKDVEDDDNITAPRSSLKVACWLRDADTAIITLLKLFLFHIIIRGFDITELEALIASNSVAGVKRKTLPKVTLYFANERNSPEDKSIWRQISFRIPGETSETFTKTEALKIANKIKSLFGNNFGWNCGRNLYSYTEWERGYQFQVLSVSSTEAKRVIKEILEINSHTPNWTYLNEISNDEPSETYPTNPATLHILGDPYKEPTRRAQVKVFFQYATLSLPPKKPIFLYDRRGLAKDPLVD